MSDCYVAATSFSRRRLATGQQRPSRRTSQSVRARPWHQVRPVELADKWLHSMDDDRKMRVVTRATGTTLRATNCPALL